MKLSDDGEGETVRGVLAKRKGKNRVHRRRKKRSESEKNLKRGNVEQEELGQCKHNQGKGGFKSGHTTAT